MGELEKARGTLWKCWGRNVRVTGQMNGLLVRNHLGEISGEQLYRIKSLWDAVALFRPEDIEHGVARRDPQLQFQ